MGTELDIIDNTLVVSIRGGKAKYVLRINKEGSDIHELDEMEIINVRGFLEL